MEFERNNMIIHDNERKMTSNNRTGPRGKLSIKNSKSFYARDNEESGIEDDSDDSESHDSSNEEYKIQQAWDELLLILKEQERYKGMKQDLEQDLEECKIAGKILEDVSFKPYLLSLVFFHRYKIIILIYDIIGVAKKN